MKFEDLSAENGCATKPSDLMAAYLQNVINYGNDYDFLSQFDFDSREDIERAILKLTRTAVNDPYFCKANRDSDGDVRCIWTTFNKMRCNVDAANKYAIAKSGELWGNMFARKRLNERCVEMFKSEPNAEDFEQAEVMIKDVYNLTDTDMSKLHYFVEQVKAGENFPNSLRRMLYIWGSAKQTGKTTTATMIVSILNGDDDYKHINKYTTTLANEMQIGSFKLPKISEAAVCLMDECFYADMGKTYNDFKRFITSSNGRARLPYGQEFEWYGQPNYVATSNESLQKFIKDWNDRRYLSIEFKGKPSRKLQFDEIYELWRTYIVNSTRTKDWYAWADEMAEASNEIGAYQETANEFDVEMRQGKFIGYIQEQKVASAPTCNENRRTLKFFVDYFAAGNTEARKQRPMIEAAAIAVFGKPHVSGNNKYWLVGEMKDIANKMYIESGDEPEDFNKPF